MSDQVWSSAAPYKDLCSQSRAEQWAIIKYADDFVIAIQHQDNETNPVLDGVMSTDFN